MTPANSWWMAARSPSAECHRIASISLMVGKFSVSGTASDRLSGQTAHGHPLPEDHARHQFRDVMNPSRRPNHGLARRHLREFRVMTVHAMLRRHRHAGVGQESGRIRTWYFAPRTYGYEAILASPHGQDMRKYGERLLRVKLGKYAAHLKEIQRQYQHRVVNQISVIRPPSAGELLKS